MLVLFWYGISWNTGIFTWNFSRVHIFLDWPWQCSRADARLYQLVLQTMYLFIYSYDYFLAAAWHCLLIFYLLFTNCKSVAELLSSHLIPLGICADYSFDKMNYSSDNLNYSIFIFYRISLFFSFFFFQDYFAF